ncbi:MAG TPA: DUF4357 domain-containing protein [Hymenobacter sp.]|uniref:DUF4357 domain-containing protein n=1 Tax=Hymenobacter sp. TaxID=1898978 RepID=UPI002D7FDDCE|nr:DUF4357 domain-containing protein [Hymenobacter sp.]HET9505354.1 DUF4357 domain-containing protein [Hymenobacter sp.]
MHEILLDIQQRLRRKEYKNEEHVRLSLVARVVQELGWDIWNPTEVYTEFKATKKEDHTRVDVALFTRDFEDTAIFIECKGVGAFAADLAAVERQLRDYNRDHTALFTIITDGRHWRFYFSFTSGEFKDKLFCKFDLQQDGLEEVAGYFDTFLRRDNITNHSARHKAEAYLMLGKKERAMQDVLPDAQKLVSQPPFPSLPEAMVQLLAAKVLTITPAEAQAFLMGTPPEKVGEPLQTLALPRPATAPAKPTTPARRPTKAVPRPPAAPTPATPLAPPAGEQFTLSQGVLQATAYLQPDGRLLVKAGSRAAALAAASLELPAQLLRQELLASGGLLPEGDYLVFAKDYLFKSANLAARIIVARSVNAQITWKHATGKQVRDFLK